MKTLLLTISSLLLTLSTPALASDPTPVCQRTQAVVDNLLTQINALQSAQKTCSDLTPADLSTIVRVDVSGRHLTELKAGDFDGLVNLEILNIRSNDYTTLPEGLFKGLTKLKTLVMIATKIRYLPDDFLADTPNLEQLYLFRSQVRTISESVLQRLEANTTFTGIELDRALFPAEKARIQKYVDAHPQLDFLFH